MNKCCDCWEDRPLNKAGRCASCQDAMGGETQLIDRHEVFEPAKSMLNPKVRFYRRNKLHPDNPGLRLCQCEDYPCCGH